MAKEKPSVARRVREHWGTRLGAVLAVIGSAVGLGNFLRFPGLAAQYDGGAFMIPYFLAMLLLGLPLAWSEWAVGRRGGRSGFHSTPGIYFSQTRSKPLALAGSLGLIVPVVIFMYYLLIEVWCVRFALAYLDGTMAGLGRAARADLQADGLPSPEPFGFGGFLGEITGVGANGSAVTPLNLTVLAVCFGLNFLLIWRGVERGIEWFCKFAMPLLALVATLLLVRVLTLPGAVEGLGAMWNPPATTSEFRGTLLNPQMWVEATGQIFFSLSVGFGLIITYASYVKPREDIALSGLTAACGNQFVEVVLAGLTIIPAAFIFLGPLRTQAAADAGSSFTLGFNTLPLAFELMPLGYTVGFLFFSLLSLAAITSSLSMLQGTLAMLQEGVGLPRPAAVLVLAGLCAAGVGFVGILSSGLVALDTFDRWVGTMFIYVLATLQAIVFGWFLGTPAGMEELDRGAAVRLPRMLGWVIRWVCPVYLLLLFGWFLYDQIVVQDGGMFADLKTNATARLSVYFMLGVIAVACAMVAVALPRWSRELAQQDLEAAEDGAMERKAAS